METVPKTDKEPIKIQYSATKRMVKGKTMPRKTHEDHVAEDGEYGTPIPMKKNKKKVAKAKKKPEKKSPVGTSEYATPNPKIIQGNSKGGQLLMKDSQDMGHPEKLKKGASKKKKKVKKIA